MSEPARDRRDPFIETATEERGEPDYYAALGLHPEAGADDIRRAFHERAKLWHPDRYMQASPELRARAERRMRALVAAHEVLDDPIKRRAYDLRHGYSVAASALSTHPAPAGHPARPGATVHPSAPVASAVHPHDASSSGPAPEATGANMFLAMLCAVLGLAILVRTLADPGPPPGALIAYAIVTGLALLALWCLAHESGPAHLADHWMAYTHPMQPPMYAGPSPGYGLRTRRSHRGHHARHARSTHRAHDTQQGKHGQPTDFVEHTQQTPPAEAEPTEFERLVDEALATIPDQFQPYLENVAVRVAAEPTEEQLQSIGAREGGFLLGLYHGVNLLHQGAAGTGPEWITIFQGPIERYCRRDPDRIREQVRRTVLHELAHHFGIDHEDMPDWIR